MILPDFSGRLVFVASAMASALLLSAVQSAQAQNINLARCEGLWFSTSEDFLSQGPQLPGGPVVSDGDLLTFETGVGTSICARNEELLFVFDTNEFDHGLDALEKIEIDRSTVFAAFSTEIDSVNGSGQFTAGDLLFSNGSVVPNNALLVQFNLPRSLNLGLDAVHIEGAPGEKRELLAKLDGTDVDQLRDNPDILVQILEGTNTDILFSTEGTPPSVQKPQFLDGDLLSAKTGAIVRSNNDLLPLLPSGLPDKGVDYGLDAYTPAMDPIENVPIELLSTEIQARDKTFSDGDALVVGPGIFLRNKDLIGSLEPLDSDMGLDALAANGGPVVDRCDFFITRISEVQISRIRQTNPAADPFAGMFDVGVLDGAGNADGDRPFGGDLRVEGSVPNWACSEYTTHEFRVEVLEEGGVTPVPVRHPLSDGWLRDTAPCGSPSDPYASTDYSPTDTGWFRLTDYWRPAVHGCANDPSLAFWKSGSIDSTTARIRIVLREIGTPGTETSSAWVRVRLDNKAPNAPVIALHDLGAGAPFNNQCEVAGGGADTVIDVHGEVFDAHFDHLRLTWTGGEVGLETTVPVTTRPTVPAPFAPLTLTRGYRTRPELQDQGTLPAGSNILLARFNLSAAHRDATGGNPPIECGYTVTLQAVDRAHVGRFSPASNGYNISGPHRSARVSQSFCFKPSA